MLAAALGKRGWESFRIGYVAGSGVLSRVALLAAVDSLPVARDSAGSGGGWLSLSASWRCTRRRGSGCFRRRAPETPAGPHRPGGAAAMAARVRRRDVAQLGRGGRCGPFRAPRSGSPWKWLWPVYSPAFRGTCLGASQYQMTPLDSNRVRHRRLWRVVPGGLGFACRCSPRV